MVHFNFKVASLMAVSLFSFSCQGQPPEPESRSARAAKAIQKAPQVNPAAQKKLVPAAAPKAGKKSDTSSKLAPGADPLNGVFSLKAALVGLPAQGSLQAKIATGAGTMTCELYEKKAPLTVANFVGLARGIRPFKDKGQWQTRPAYDGTTFHRVVKGFMIQGGDPSGTGAGEPGYVVKDEIWPGSRHDKKGQLCMANRGKDTNGQQFFITDGPAKYLDGKYTIFGQCSPESVIEKIAGAAVRGERALKPVQIKSIKITRKGS